MPKTKNVTVIPATLAMHTGRPMNTLVKRRVAGYARVSTDSEEQFTSYEAQIEYYTKLIKGHDGWQFVEVYTDEGISGTNTKHRDGFNRMIEDALAGRIDLIVTKSVSRFARNTVDSLVTVRKLKEKGVEVYFEKENIYTLDSKGELLITIMSSLAQEESRSISENVTWGQRKRFADGKVRLPYKRFMGYAKGEDGQPVIVEEEAEIIREIYDLFISGKTPKAIAKLFTQRGVPTPGGQTKWYENTIYSILQNEKYKGAALLQKKFTTDFLTKKQKVNEGEVPQYYVKESHPAIIDPQLWELTQMEMSRRRAVGKNYSGNSIFSARIICGDCGCFYGPRYWSTKSEGRRIVWRCAKKYGKDGDCESPIVTENELKMKFVEALNDIVDERDLVLDRCRSLYESFLDTSALDDEITEHVRECEILAELSRRLVEENARQEMDQDEFLRKYGSYATKNDAQMEKVEQLKALRAERLQKAEAVSAFMFEIHEQERFIEDFSEKLWLTTIETVTVYHDGRMVFRFKNGMEVTK